jgi:hypothetical protein
MPWSTLWLADKFLRVSARCHRPVSVGVRRTLSRRIERVVAVYDLCSINAVTVQVTLATQAEEDVPGLVES